MTPKGPRGPTTGDSLFSVQGRVLTKGKAGPENHISWLGNRWQLLNLSEPPCPAQPKNTAMSQGSHEA